MKLIQNKDGSGLYTNSLCVNMCIDLNKILVPQTDTILSYSVMRGLYNPVQMQTDFDPLIRSLDIF